MSKNQDKKESTEFVEITHLFGRELLAPIKLRKDVQEIFSKNGVLLASTKPEEKK